MDGGTSISIKLLNGLGDVDAALWDACAAPEAITGGRALNPFLTHRWLSAFEESGSAHWREGWDPKHLLAEDEAGQTLGVMPLYVKGHSQGEYVFDHGWAQAFERAGGDYYPKLLSATPFTPVTGRRLLAHPDADLDLAESALLSGAAQITNDNELSSLHMIFCTEGEQERLGKAGFLTRKNQQFHWRNYDYADFDAFLTNLSSRKRKAIRKERAKAVENVEIVHLTGEQIQPEHWDAFWTFYQDTGARKYGTPYLTRSFFQIAQERLRDDILLVFARRDGQWVAGALNVIGRDTLYGRYWGCTEDHPCLHFEICYYQAIDYAIRHGMKTVEAGAQGEHKLARGYEPTETWSAHWIANPDFRRAISNYLDHERRAVDEEIAILGEHTPFKKG
jgi:predicted N-acyltransferase